MQLLTAGIPALIDLFTVCIFHRLEWVRPEASEAFIITNTWLVSLATLTAIAFAATYQPTTDPRLESEDGGPAACGVSKQEICDHGCGEGTSGLAQRLEDYIARALKDAREMQMGRSGEEFHKILETFQDKIHLLMETKETDELQKRDNVITRLQSQNTHEQREVTRLQSQLQAQQRRVEQLESDVSTRGRLIDEMSSERTNLQAQLGAHQQLKDGAGDKDIRLEFDKVVEALGGKTEKLEACEREVEKLRAHLTRVNSEAARLASEHDSRLSQLLADLRQRDEEVRTMQATQTINAEEIVSLKGRLDQGEAFWKRDLDEGRATWEHLLNTERVTSDHNLKNEMATWKRKLEECESLIQALERRSQRLRASLLGVRTTRLLVMPHIMNAGLHSSKEYTLRPDHLNRIHMLNCCTTVTVKEPQIFRFDYVFDGDATNFELRSITASLAEQVLIGGNACIVAVGMPGVGIPATLYGHDESIAVQVARGLCSDVSRPLHVSCVEIRPEGVAEYVQPPDAFLQMHGLAAGQGGDYALFKLPDISALPHFLGFVARHRGHGRPETLEPARGHLRIDIVVETNEGKRFVALVELIGGGKSELGKMWDVLEPSRKMVDALESSRLGFYEMLRTYRASSGNAKVWHRQLKQSKVGTQLFLSSLLLIQPG